MEKIEKIQSLIWTAGLVTGLVFLQQLIVKILFGVTYDWPAVPGLILANFGIVAGWYYIKDPDKKIPMFAIIIAAVCFTVWLRAVIIYLGVFRLVAPLVLAFIEKQFNMISAIIVTPQFIPASIAAVILLMLLPKAREVYRRIISNGRY